MDNDELLLRILAQVDATFYPRPFRYPGDGRQHCALWQLRRSYLDGGMIWTSELAGGDGSTAAGKRIQRGLADLVKSGFIERRAPRGARMSRVKLTEAGDDRARQLASAPARAQALAYAKCVSRRRASKRLRREDGVLYVDEIALNDVRWGHKDYELNLLFHIAFLLPLLTTGLIDSNSDGRGLMIFEFTSDLLAMLKAGDYPMPEIDDSVTPAWEAYMDFRKAAYESLSQAAVPDPNEIGDPPVSW